MTQIKSCRDFCFRVKGLGGVGGGWGGGERQADRQTEEETDRQTDRQTDSLERATGDDGKEMGVALLVVSPAFPRDSAHDVGIFLA